MDKARGSGSCTSLYSLHTLGHVPHGCLDPRVHAMDVLAERQDGDKRNARADRRSRYTVCFDPVHWGAATDTPNDTAAGTAEKIAHAGPQQRTCDQCAVS